MGVSAEERRAKLAAVNDAATELSRLRKDLRRLEDAIRPNLKRKRRNRGRAPSEAAYAGGASLSFDFGTGAGLAWEGQGAGSLGVNLDFF